MGKLDSEITRFVTRVACTYNGTNDDCRRRIDRPLGISLKIYLDFDPSLPIIATIYRTVGIIPWHYRFRV